VYVPDRERYRQLFALASNGRPEPASLTFDQLRIPFEAKRSSLIAWDEARSRNLIFVGGPEVNDSQMQLPSLEQFGFKSIEEYPSAGLGSVVNLHLEAEDKHYHFNSGAPYTMHYAVIGVVPALTPGRRALILAGPTTFGTQGGAEFLLDENSVSAAPSAGASIYRKSSFLRGALASED